MDVAPVTEKRVSTDFLLMFAPEQWTFAQRFLQFMGPPFEVKFDLSLGARTASSHTAKYRVLAGLANRLRQQLNEDDAELKSKGHSSAIRSKEYAALIETMFCELYASLDGIRRLLFAAFRNVQGVQNKSTEKLFVRAKENGYGVGFPADITAILATAYDTWFVRLRNIRTEVTHGDIGSCHVDASTQKVSYMHIDLGTSNKSLVIDDIESELNTLFENVIALNEGIFASLCTKLVPEERTVLCGIYKGRAYQRNVAFSPTLTFNDGCCTSLQWFHAAPGIECPLRDNCGAYQSAKGVELKIKQSNQVLGADSSDASTLSDVQRDESQQANIVQMTADISQSPPQV